jgi:hypothetical protein
MAAQSPPPRRLTAAPALRHNRVMRFRLIQTVTNLSLHPDGVKPITLSLVGIHGHNLRVTLDGGDGDMTCVAETEFEPSRRIVHPFRSLEANRVPEDHLPQETAAWGRRREAADLARHRSRCSVGATLMATQVLRSPLSERISAWWTSRSIIATAVPRLLIGS